MRTQTYTKKEIVKQTAERLDLKVTDTEAIVDGVFVTLREMLSEDRPSLRIEIRGFGVFEVKQTKAKPKA